MILDPIPLSGPSITHREIECAADAAAIAWNARQGEYVRRFETAMREYLGIPHAFATINRVAALHLALLALGVRQGDEVLVPEIADISVARSVLYTGAKPVFCDVDPLTLCLSPQSVSRKVTPATRAIIPVHMYGQACDMDPLLELASQRALAVVEDATQGIGAVYKGRRAGSFGTVTVFGFDGREAVVCGQGGMLLCRDGDLAARAVRLGMNGRSAANPFVYDAVGFDYAMADQQAALGLAQMERLEELLAKKAVIHGWYREGLAGVSGIRLNAQIPESPASFLMTVLGVEDASVLRTDFLRRLAASGVMARPVPYPLSSMPFFNQAGKSDNPVAYSAGARALLLPSGHNRTEEEIDYVCGVVKALLADRSLPRATVPLTGWLRYKSQTLERIASIKREGLSLFFDHDGKQYELRALTAHDAVRPEIISFMGRLRRENMGIFLRQHQASDEFMRATLSNYAEKARDFLLFLVAEGVTLHGHMGLDDFAFQKRECVAEAFMMRENSPRGLAAAASDAMYAWARDELGIRRVFNHVLGSNRPVRFLAASQGFCEINRTALYRRELPEGAVMRPMYIQGHDSPDDYFVFSAKDL